MSKSTTGLDVPENSSATHAGEAATIEKLEPRDGTEKTAALTITNSEQEFLEKQLKFDDVKISFWGIYRFATWYDVVLVALSSVCAVIAGALVPITPIISSRIILAFAGAQSRGEDLKSLMDEYTIYYVYIVVAALVTWFASTAGFNHTGTRITRAIKMQYFAAVMRQNMAIFDDQGTGDILSQLTDDAKAIQNAISSKLSQTISAFGTLVATVAVCFALDWTLTLEIIWSLALGYGVLYLGGKLTVRYSSRSIEASSAGSGVIEEALGSIKTTTALGMQGHVHRTYMKFLSTAAKNGFILGSLNAGMLSICVASGYINVAIVFWQGSRRFTEDKTSFTSIVAIGMVAKAAAFCVLGVGSNMEAFAMAVAAARRLSRMTRRSSPIDSLSEAGSTPGLLSGNIELRNVRHVYPCRPSTTVLDDVSIRFPAGQTTAIVGQSGSGKSSIANLLLRFYDPLGGRILLDNRDLASYQIRWLRQQIAVVKQESFMFNRSVYENIECGFVGPQWSSVSSEEKRKLVLRAAEMAQAEDFINKLPQGFETVVGARGSRLSGGQLQRIAIARALVGDPRILILDEATSALDSETEARMLATMSDASNKRTAIVIAHRLSTIREADNIVVLSAGRVVESGTHADLMAAESFYFDLVQAQDLKQHEDTTGSEMSLNEKRDSESAAPRSLMEKTHEGDMSDGRLSIEDQMNAPAVSTSLFSMIKFVFSLNKKELPWILVGLIACILAGGEEPVSAVLFGKAITAIARPKDQADSIRADTGFYSWMFFMLAFVMLLSCAAQGIAFAYSSEHLINRVRSLVIQKVLKMDINFFDRKENSSAALSGFISSTTGDIAGISGSALGTILICISTLLSGIVVSLALGWKLALVCFAVVPLMIGGGYYGVWLVGEFEKQVEMFANKASEFAGETLSGIQTIAALTGEKAALDQFHEALHATEKTAAISNLQVSFMYALTQTAYYACNALSFWYGGRLVLRGEYTLFQAVAVQSAMLLSAFSAGLVFSWTPNIGRAKQSAASLQRLLNQKSQIDPSSPDGTWQNTIRGQIQFDSVSFAYPTRPDQPALSKVSLTIPAGSNIAFVGHTGSGKSTVISLIERFYDPTAGTVLIDSQPVKSLVLSKYRKCIGLVSQDPHLFSGTIRMNLVVGLEEDGSSISDASIEEACRKANIYDFIISLPDGFNTLVGSRGNQLSVGQKQRIALARALLREPKILLLDEATSALDSQSESLIQKALEQVKEGRTVVTVAHRLSTVVNADKIFVLDHGTLVESGTHSQLMAMKGRYYGLFMASVSGQLL